MTAAFATALTGAAGRVMAGGDSAVGEGFIGFVVVVVLSVACYFLFRSMNRHLRNVPRSFDDKPPPAGTDDRP